MVKRAGGLARIARILATESRPSIIQYLKGSLRADAVAGLTVAVLGVPQAIAYAMIAGLDPVYGLYTAIVTCAVAALLGSSRHLITGPTNGVCIVLASLTGSLQGVNAFEAILLLSFLSGCIQVGFGLFRLGNIVRYVSSSVVVGFTAGAGVLIAVNQFHNVLGIDISKDAERTYEILIATIEGAGATNFYAVAIAAITAAIVLLPKLHKRLRRLPAALIGVAVAGAVSYWLGWHLLGEGHRVVIVKEIGEGIVPSLDIFHVPELILNPDIGLTQDLFAGAFAISILSLIEATSISRVVARSSRQKLDFNREFIGQGVSKIVGSFFKCFAGSGSMMRTMVCYQSGGQTRMAAVFSAIWTALTLLLFAPVANYIPKPALAGMICVIAYSMVDKQRIKLSWQSGHNSRIVLVGTLLATLVLKLEYSIYIGVMLSLVVILRETGKTDLTQLVPRPDGDFDEVPFNRAAPSPILTVNMSGDIYFAAAEDLDSELLRSLTPETRVVVLRMKRLRAAGSTAMGMLEHFWQLLRERKIYLIVCGVERQLETLMTSTGLRRKIGDENIFYADNKLFQATRLAMARANAVFQRYQDAHRSDHAQKVDADKAPSVLVDSRSLMTTRFPLFGFEHQTREAVWLLSEAQKYRGTINPEPLFLQDRNGALFGELSRWDVLEALVAGSDPEQDEQLDDRQVADLLRRNFAKRINHIARTDVVRHRLDTPITALLRTSARQGQAVVPICDDAGRLKGYCMSNAMLAGLDESLTRMLAHAEQRSHVVSPGDKSPEHESQERDDG